MEERTLLYVFMFSSVVHQLPFLSLMVAMKLDVQVLLHLLRAGYFLYKGEQQSCSKEDIKDFPIRTIYFESPSAFPEINSFTYDMVSK